jgi:hypothetical protein
MIGGDGIAEIEENESVIDGLDFRQVILHSVEKRRALDVR